MASYIKQIKCANVLYCDDNLIIINKLPGIPVIPARGKSRVCSLHEQLEEELAEKIFVVHRIDQATSGIIIFARNSKAHRILCALFEKRTIMKRYIALIYGSLHGEGIFEAPIHQFGSGRMGVHPRGKAAETRYSVVEQFKDTSLVNVYPLTGRRHQIRVHFYNAGCPIIGDTMYGNDRPVGGALRLMLHASEVDFAYDKERHISVSAPTDAMWNAIIDSFKNGTNDIKV